MNETLKKIQTRCCIAGGGPAGMMLGFLLARAGVDVVVLEKYPDFFRDFRGDTIHPSTLQLMHELGLLEEFLKRPHQEAPRLNGKVGGSDLMIADFSHLPTHCKFIAIMPQWDFLNFIAEQAKKFPNFRLMMQTEAKSLIIENGVVKGVNAQTPGGPLEIRADLTVAADGRHSTLRLAAGLESVDIGAPIDVLWMRLSRQPSDRAFPFGTVEQGHMFVMIDRSDYWQCAYVIPKGGIKKVKAAGLPALRQSILGLAPFLKERVEEIKNWNDVKLLTVSIDRLKTWHREGFVCIGDAAHAMSPVGGVGINLAVQDAVAAANILALPLRENCATPAVLAQIKQRRWWPTIATQAVQVFIQKRLIYPALQTKGPIQLPWPLKLIKRWPVLAYIPAHLIGIGFRPEHISQKQDS